MENARCRVPCPEWQSPFERKPSSRSCSSTRISSSLVFDTISSRAIELCSEPHRHRLEAGRANRGDDRVRGVSAADRDDRPAPAAARELRAERAVLARDVAKLLELRGRNLQGVQHALTNIHELAQRWE